MFNDFETKLKEDDGWQIRYVHIYNGLYIANTENEYKKGNKIGLNEENEYVIEEKSLKERMYLIFVLNFLKDLYSSYQKQELSYFNSQ